MAAITVLVAVPALAQDARTAAVAPDALETATHVQVAYGVLNAMAVRAVVDAEAAEDARETARMNARAVHPAHQTATLPAM